MTTAIYVRISLDREGKSAGVDRQQKDCQALVKKHGWGPAVVFKDNDSSAFSGKVRPGYADLLAKVKAGEIDRIVVYHADRLYRRPKELEVLIDLADAGRLQIASVNSAELDLSNSDGRMVARMLIAMASKSSEDTSRRVKAAKLANRETGKHNGGPRPFGWTATWVYPDGKRQRRLTVDPVESALIKTAAADLLRGASLRDIAKRWNATAVRTPLGPKRVNGVKPENTSTWSGPSVRQVLGKPMLAGLVGHRQPIRKDAKIVGYGPVEILKSTATDVGTPILDREEWEQLQALLEQRGANGHAPRRRSLLTGLVTCATCGANMVRSGSSRSDRMVWRCRTPAFDDAGKHLGAVHASIGADDLENLLTEATLRAADTAAFAAMVRQRGREGKQAAEVVAELEENDRRMDAATASHNAGRLSLRALEHISADYERKRKALQAKLGPLTTTAALEPYAGRRGALRTAWPNLSVDQQRAIIAAALGPVTVAPSDKPGRPTFDASRVQIAGPRVGAA